MIFCKHLLNGCCVKCKRFSHCRFVDGLGCLGLHAAMKTHFNHLRYLFLAKDKTLTAKDLIDLFTPQFAEEGSNRRHNEIKTYAWFRDFLLDVEGIISLVSKTI